MVKLLKVAVSLSLLTSFSVVSSGCSTVAKKAPADVAAGKSILKKQQVVPVKHYSSAKTYKFSDRSTAVSAGALLASRESIYQQVGAQQKGDREAQAEIAYRERRWGSKEIPLPTIKDNQVFVSPDEEIYQKASVINTSVGSFKSTFDAPINTSVEVRKTKSQRVKAKVRQASPAKQFIKTSAKPNSLAVRKAALREAKNRGAQGLSHWQNISKGFRLEPHLDKKLVSKFIVSYAKNGKMAVTKMGERAAVFLPMITAEVKRRGMPMEIALLPFVESGFAVKAVSSANAAGLWQFIPETGERYGLKKTASYDGRFNPYAATTAALDYLQDLHKRFDGDWLLALAAYNSGENRVSRLVRKQKKRGKPADFWSLTALPKETREYVPRLLAYRELIRRPQSYGIKLPVNSHFMQLKRLIVSKPVNLKQLAKKAKLPKQNILAHLNPNFSTGMTQPKDEKNLLVPVAYFDRVKVAAHHL